MTGRKGRVVSNDDGSISYESRSELDVPVEILNLTEKQRFMDGEKVEEEHGSCYSRNKMFLFFCLLVLIQAIILICLCLPLEHRHHL